MKSNQPPRLLHRFFRWFCHPELLKYIEGDLMELYEEGVKEKGKRKADWRFAVDVLLLFRPGIIRPIEGYENLNHYGMFKSYFTIGWRNVLRNKAYSFINIGGLAIGMTVAMFIGLWIYDEISFDRYHENYRDIAQVWGGGINQKTSMIGGSTVMQYPVGAALKNNYPQYFKHVIVSRFTTNYTLSTDEEKFGRSGNFFESGILEMLSLKMLRGSYESLNKPNAIVLSRSTAEAIFGDEDPMAKSLQINGRMDVEVTGIYEDIPRNNSFSDVKFFAPWTLWVSANEWMKGKESDWDNRSFQVYVQVQPNVSLETANASIKDLYYKNVPQDFFNVMEKDKPFVQLVPMSTWHLYNEFENGKPAGGLITLVWLFGVIGIFVLLLACINFVNLSTARSEKRAKEVGVRKTIGTAKIQLVVQFLSESFMVVIIAFVLSAIMAVFLLGWFNELANKDMVLPFANPVFWAIAAAFVVLTAVVAGIYPAFYLSSFQPVKVLKGMAVSGRFVALPRRILVVTQFAVSVTLILGTMIVYQQIQFARSRPIGYDREGIISLGMNDPNYIGKYDVLRAELLSTGVVSETGTSSSPLTAIWNTTSGYQWEGKEPGRDVNFAICNVTTDYGKTIGWQIVEGRDFSHEFPADSLNSIIVNEAAVNYMGLKDPVGKELINVDEFGQPVWSKTIIGVVKNMVMESPYQPVRQILYYYNSNAFNLLHIRIDPGVSASTALPKIKSVIEKVVPTALFDYKFVDEEYARKFNAEERISKLSGVFSILAIFISCLGLFGLASFIAEQRTKEIGIRKVMGASVSTIWRMLSKDFVMLIVIACCIAIPVAWYFMHRWLENYAYHTHISWQIFLITVVGALAITLATVSFQAVRAATSNPVKSLRSE